MNELTNQLTGICELLWIQARIQVCHTRLLQALTYDERRELEAELLDLREELVNFAK